MPNFVNLARFNASSSGTGDFVVSSAATGYQTPAAANASNGLVYSYRAESNDLSQWELGYGAYTSGTTTLARTFVLANSSGGTSKINFSAAPQVALLATAQDLNSVAPVSPGGRASLTSAVALTISDVVGATSIYYVSCTGGTVPVYDGAATQNILIGSSLSLALDPISGHTGYHQSGKNFDIFGYAVSGNLVIGTGPAWTSDTARGTGAGTTELELKNGFWTNKNSITLRFGASSGNTNVVAANQATYLGSFRATADGQASDTVKVRLLYNAYNQALRQITMVDSGSPSSHAYSTQTYRYFNNDSTNKIDVLFGLSGGFVSAKVQNLVTNSTTTARVPNNAIGLDGVSTVLSNPMQKSITSAANETVLGMCDSPVDMGYHYVTWLERGAGSDTQTWFSSTSILYGSVVQ